MERVRDEIPQVFSQFELGLNFDDFSIVTLVFAQILVGCLVHVHNPFRSLEPGNFIFHTTELLLYNEESFVDELGCIDGYAVLFPDGIFVILLHQSVEDVIGTTKRVILHGQLKDCAIALGDFQSGQKYISRICYRPLINCDQLAGTFPFEMRSWSENYLSSIN